MSKQDQIPHNPMMVVVPCIMCERAKPQCYQNIEKTYPVTLITNVLTQTGFKHATIQAYLCEPHFQEHEIKQKEPVKESNAN